MTKLERLSSYLEPEQVFLDEPLANHTTLRIGGPADLLYRAKTTELLIKVARAAMKFDVPITMLGWGSNVLVSDKGIRGLVIKNEIKDIKIGKVLPAKKTKSVDKPRWQSDKTKGTFKYEFNDLDYDETGLERVRVKMASGVSLQMAISSLLSEGVTGLQWYARIPGTIGGAIYNNIHGGTHFISEVVKKVKILDGEGKMKFFFGKELGLAYDKSRFHDSGEIILEVELELFKGDVERARQTALEWAKRKSLQPQRSAGCTFKNISNEDKERLGFPTTSVGYIVEYILKLGGRKIGGAKVSIAHCNFIVNDGGATAKDYLRLVKEITSKTKKKLGIELVPEIIFLGEF